MMGHPKFTVHYRKHVTVVTLIIFAAILNIASEG
jgi:hypothetical protein